MPFTGDINLRALPGSEWLLIDPVTYHGNPAHGGDVWTIPGDFHTDLASVPASMTWAVARYGKVTQSALLHDYLCLLARASLFNRRDADGILRRVLRESGIPTLLCWLMWAAVRFDSRLSDATGHEVALWALWAVLALPVLLISGLVVWPAQQALRLAERM